MCSFAEHCALSVCSYSDTGNEKITFSDIDSHKQTIDATHISQIDKVTLCASFTRQKAKAIRDLQRAADIISPPNEWDDTDNIDDGQHCIFRTSMNGQFARTLADTGASTEYCDVQWATKIGADIKPCRLRTIKLGNNTVQTVTKMATIDTWVGEMNVPIKYLLMPLPQGVQSILGCSFFIKHDVYLHPRSRRMFACKDTETHPIVIATALEEDGIDRLVDTPLVPAGDLCSSATDDSKSNREHKQYLEPNTDLRELPRGIYNLSMDESKYGPCDVINAGPKLMQSAIKLMQQNKLNHDVTDTWDPANDKCTKTAKKEKLHALRHGTDLSGQSFSKPKSAAAGQKIDKQLQTAARNTFIKNSKDSLDPEEECFLVTLRPLADGTYSATDEAGHDILRENYERRASAFAAHEQTDAAPVMKSVNIQLHGTDRPTRLARGMPVTGEIPTFHTHASYRDPSCWPIFDASDVPGAHHQKATQPPITTSDDSLNHTHDTDADNDWTMQQLKKGDFKTRIDTNSSTYSQQRDPRYDHRWNEVLASHSTSRTREFPYLQQYQHLDLNSRGGTSDKNSHMPNKKGEIQGNNTSPHKKNAKILKHNTNRIPGSGYDTHARHEHNYNLHIEYCKFVQSHDDQQRDPSVPQKLTQKRMTDEEFPIDTKLVDQTAPKFKDWVQALKDQRIKKYSCMDPIREYCPLPTDPLLHIKVKEGATMPKPQRFKTPRHMLPQLKEFLTEMLQKKFLRPSRSPYSSPILVIPKPMNPDGSSRGFRLVTDYRAINAVVEPIQHYIPDVHSMYEKLRNAKYISTLDLKNGYWLSGLDEKSKELTAFSCEFGTFEYNVTPQGLVCSAAHFQNWVGDTRVASLSWSGIGSNP